MHLDFLNMPYPKISPVLNNCPFYALTPEIREELLNFAADDAHDNGHNAQYTLLKKHFGTYYGIDPLSWKDFSGILKSYNAFDIQIVLGPVLRNFSKEMMQNEEELDWLVALAAGNNIYDVEEYIKATTEINVNNGRYDSLNPDHMFRYLSGPLGLSLTYQKTGEPKQSFNADKPVAAINIYHEGNIHGAQAGGHWERTQNLDDAVDYQSAADTQLTPLLPLLGDNANLNSVGINLLKQHVQLMHRHKTTNYDMTHDARDLMLTGAQVRQYMWNMNYVLKPLAVKLLGEPLTGETQRLIGEMEIGDQDRDPRIQAYFEAPAEWKPFVHEDAKKIIGILGGGVVVPQFFIPPVQEVVDEGIVDALAKDIERNPMEVQPPVVKKGNSPKVGELVEAFELEDLFVHDEPQIHSPSPVAVAQLDEIAAHKDAPKRGKDKKKAAVDIHGAHEVDHGAKKIEGQITAPKRKHRKDKKKTVVDEVDHVVLELNPDTVPVVTLPQVKDKVVVQTSPIQRAPIIIDEHEEELAEPLMDLVDPIVVAHQQPVANLPTDINPVQNTPVLPHIKNGVIKKILFDNQLKELWTQVLDLKKRRDEKTVGSEDYNKLDEAYDKANKLHGIFQKSGQKYFNKEISYAEFKKTSDDAIKDAKPVLEVHRGWKELLANIALIVVSLIRSAYHGKMTFFQFDTESMKKVNAVEVSVNKAAPGA